MLPLNNRARRSTSRIDAQGSPFESAGGGSGVVRDNLTGRDTYMRMGAVSGGLGIGFKDTRTVLIFRKRDLLKQFLDKGWTFSGEAEATAKVEGKGGTAGALETPEGIIIFQLGTAGLMAKGTVQGTRYWKDDELNCRCGRQALRLADSPSTIRDLGPTIDGLPAPRSSTSGQSGGALIAGFPGRAATMPPAARRVAPDCPIRTSSA
jgi:hypothetical protein